ncbi:hypothetical protein [Kaarinaea lacus]
MLLTHKKYLFYLLFSAIFCWFFSVMVGLTTLQSQNPIEIFLKGIVVGIGGWCGWGIIRRRRQVVLFAVGLCFYAIFGSLVWLYHSILLPLMYGQETRLGLYDYLAIIYIIGGAIVVWFLLHRDNRRFFKDLE